MLIAGYTNISSNEVPLCYLYHKENGQWIYASSHLFENEEYLRDLLMLNWLRDFLS